MKPRLFAFLFSITLILPALWVTGCDRDRQTHGWTLPSLPRPIAEERVLITSAGQCTDAYIVAEIANDLMIHNYFMPQVRNADMLNVKSMVVVAGYSPVGMKSNGISFDSEKERLKLLLENARSKGQTVLIVFIGGKERRGSKTDELLRLIAPKGDYIIGLKEANYDGFLTTLARENMLPVTLVKEVDDIREPFTSAFR